MCMFLHCGGHGVLSLLAWLAEELSRWNTIVILIIVPDGGLEALSWLVEESTGGKGVGKIQIEDMAVRRTFRLPQYASIYTMTRTLNMI